MRWLLSLFCFILFFVALPGADPSPQCQFSEGQHVKLFSIEYDPKVLVWDSRAKLLGYIDKDWIFSEGYESTNIVDPNTVALVITPCPSQNEKVLEVKVLSGKHQGLYGWVNVKDIKN